MDIESKDILVVVEVQKDFLPGGALAVAGGDHVIEPINRVMPLFSYVVASRDWHPREHPHFRDHGGPWPHHCLQNTEGAEFATALHVQEFDEILDKGATRQYHGYDAFEGCDLAQRMHSRGVKRIFVCGLATDYCVKATAVASIQHGFETFVMLDAIAAVAVDPSDEPAALNEMTAHGVRFLRTADLRIATHA